MAPPSPRRSSRARATNSTSQQSSVSSGMSGRVERTTRSINKPSSTKSTPSGSLSSEPLEDFDDTLLGRRRKRNHDDEVEKAAKQDIFDIVTASDELPEEEDEAVRCLCGSEDYPGRPPVEGADADIFAAIEFTEDVTGFFVQCDVCKVWQHGACVGIFSAESSPDEYFCEQCRKDLHKIHTASNGQKYSKYLPLTRPSRSTSRATSVTKDGVRSPKASGSKSRPTSASYSSKRRSTMNSRDRAYEDEQLLRAIEASKEDAPLDAPESLVRRHKRTRSGSDENLFKIKRQRTSSQSASPPPETAEVLNRDESEEELHTRNGLKKARNSNITRDKVEKEERERQRQEAADKRKGRAERRRAEDSDPSEETPAVPAKPVAAESIETPIVAETPVVEEPTPDTPPATLPPSGSTSKRGGRGHPKKGKARNQLTRERETDNGDSPARSMSRDIQKNGDDVAAHSKVTGEHRNGKAKPALSHKLSMVDMKRRVGAIMDFISRTQVDLAAETFPFSNGISGQVSPQKPSTPCTNGHADAQSTLEVNGTAGELSQEKHFNELNCMEMMDILTRDMVKWQSQYSR